LKKIFKGMAISLAAVITLAGCSSNTNQGGSAGASSATTGTAAPAATTAAKDVITLKMSTVLPDTEIQSVGAQKFADEVEKTTNGKLKIQLFANGMLGKDLDVLNGLKVNTVELWMGGAGNLNASADTAKIFTVPFMFDNQEHFDKVYSGPIGQEISDKIDKESGLKIISYWTRGARWLTTNKVVKTPEDLKGLKIRVPESPVFVKTFTRLGAAPTPMDFGQVFTSLQQKVIDGQENPLSLIYSSHFNEVNKYLIKTEHVFEPIVVVINSKKFNSLSPDLQKALMDAVNGIGKKYISDEVKKGDNDFLKKLQDGGMTLIEPDKAAFQAKLNGFVSQEFPALTDIYDKIRAAK
jgi:tripartite ATP-independent transporter DctP family solute receptor